MSREHTAKLPSRFARTLVFGNGGSGKTLLARHLATAAAVRLVQLDDLHWEPGRYGVARDKQVVADLVRAEAASENWVIEGVYGWLAQIALPCATALIWLDIDVDECIDNIKQRGTQGGESDNDFQGLLKWVAEYPLRTNSNSYAAHCTLFSQFEGEKHRLTSRDAITEFIEFTLAVALN